jgi:hypothetical protein
MIGKLLGLVLKDHKDDSTATSCARSPSACSPAEPVPRTGPLAHRFDLSPRTGRVLAG